MSLHTQHRPTKFDEILGQNHVISSLKRVVKEGRSKSFIFVGPSGVGKTTLARILANEFAGGKATQANMEEINAADHSGADDMRGVVNRSLYRAIGSSPIKAIIIDECHRLSGAAWTVLLKPTEEPPKHVFWLLCTTDPGKVPKTIFTRFLRYDLKPVGEELIAELLLSVCDLGNLTPPPDPVIEAIANEAGGSPRQALVFLEACLGCKTTAEARILMRSAGQSAEVIELCRWLIQPRGGWAEAVKLVKKLEGFDAESIRINTINYLSQVLLNAKGDAKAKQLLTIMEPFSEPFNASDKLAPLLRSIALAIGMDR
jgi:DNA polymerase-3 subunit gamma/tau